MSLAPLRKIVTTPQHLSKANLKRFLWVVYQLNHLGRSRRAISKETLERLPKGLSQTYCAWIGKLEREDQLLAREILRFIMFSYRPLDLKELVEAVAVQPGMTRFKALEKYKLRQPDDIFEICGGLVRYSRATGHIVLAHHSVYEFLTSPILKDGQRNPCFISSNDAPRMLAMTCFTYLNMRDLRIASFHSTPEGNDTTIVDEEKLFNELISEHPFLGYAASNCWRHLLEVENIGDLWSLIRSFFEEHGNFRFWITFARYTYGYYRYPGNLNPWHVCAIYGLQKLGASLLRETRGIGAQTSDGRTPLHLAIENEKNDMVWFLLTSGAPLDKKDGFGRSCLYLAIELCNEYAAEVLIRRGANVDTAAGDGSTPLSMAVENNLNDLVRKIVRKSDHEYILEDGRTTLHLIAQSGLLDSAKIIFQVYRNPIPRRPIRHVNAKDRYGWTALHFAAHYGHPDMVSLLLANNAICEADFRGWTPVHAAIRSKNIKSLAILLGRTKPPLRTPQPQLPMRGFS
jgi:ankyrin repeat protein